MNFNSTNELSAYVTIKLANRASETKWLSKAAEGLLKSCIWPNWNSNYDSSPDGNNSAHDSLNRSVLMDFVNQYTQWLSYTVIIRALVNVAFCYEVEQLYDYILWDKNSHRIYLLKVNDLTEQITIRDVNQLKKIKKDWNDMIWYMPINQPLEIF